MIVRCLSYVFSGDRNRTSVSTDSSSLNMILYLFNEAHALREDALTIVQKLLLAQDVLGLGIDEAELVQGIFVGEIDWAEGGLGLLLHFGVFIVILIVEVTRVWALILVR